MNIFISYRREDSAGYTGRLYDSLRTRFGDDHVFLDLSGIGSGQRFADVIHTAIRDCDVLLAVIGPSWATCTVDGQRRLEAEDDLVRGEIAAALEAHIPVIPVLVGGTRPPRGDALPGPLRPLAALDAHEMSDERWTYDVERLMAAIGTLAVGAVRADARRRRLMAAAGVAAAALVIAGVLYALRPAPTPAIAGSWSAEVRYPWGTRVTERLVLRLDGRAVAGTASFLGVPRTITAGTIAGDRLTFDTRTQEVTGNWDDPHDLVHHYEGRVAGDAIAFTMRTDGGTATEPVEFTATRTSPER